MHTIINHRNIKTIKIPTISPTCFGSRRNHRQGAVSCLAKTTTMILRSHRYGRDQCHGSIPACRAIWGWRLLFYFCSIMGVIGFLTRYIMEESLAYKAHDQNKSLSNSPFLELIRGYKRIFVIAIGLGIAQNAIVCSAIMFYNISVKELILSGIDIKNMVRIISEITFGMSAVLFATLSDKVGRRNVMIPTLITLACISLPGLSLLSYNNHYIVTFTYLLISVLLGASFGIYNSLVCELFLTKVRFTGLSLAHNISAGIFGGLSPFVCT